MTHEEDNAVAQLKIAIGDRKGDYAYLTETERLGDGGGVVGDCIGGEASSGGVADCMAVTSPPSPVSRCIWWSIWWWTRLVLVFMFLAALGICFILWIGPYLMNKEVVPILNWETKTFDKPMLAVLIFGSVALFPCILLPSTPSMWVAGMSFGYGLGFLLIIAGAAIGVSLPFLVGSLFYNKIHAWLERYPKKASILRLAGEGSWFNQFKTVMFLRISPFPYLLYNYCAVATDVKFFPYLLGTLVGMVPEILVAIYTGIMIRTLADASNTQQALSGQQITCTVFGFLLTIATTVLVTVYAKRRLGELQEDEEQLLLH